MATKQNGRASRRAGQESVAVIEHDPDVALVEAESSIIRTFLTGLATFFRGAQQLEDTAKATLARSRTWALPTNGAADAMMQKDIQTVNAQIKAVEDHWSVCQALSRLHRKMTARRGVAVQMLEDARGIGQRLHNTYADNERRRAQEEQDRLRREEEDRQRKRRETELADLERQAVAAEEASPDLSEREESFVSIYVEHSIHGGNAQASAQLAGFKEPMKAAARLISMPKIQAAIKARQDAIAAREQAAALREQPVVVEAPVVRPDVMKVGSDRKYKAAEIFDADAFVAAVLDPSQRLKLGIPADTVSPNQTKLNELARMLGEQINRWPGVRLKQTTRTI